MSESAVDHIWQQIQLLREDELLSLQERLAAVADQRWREEAASARRLAQQRGVDQAAIDRAVNKVRYGR